MFSPALHIPTGLESGT